MSQTIEKTSEHYSELVARQVDQYRETEVMHDLPPIFDYWATKHNAPKSRSVSGKENLISFYASYFQQSLETSDSCFLVSIGSGDSSIEIAIVKELLARKVKNFFFICLELSPVLIEKARKKIDEEKLGDIITAACIDINNWQPNYTFAGVMAHHSLHHILELEQLFSIIRNNLASKGLFITADMIGRNGHMRWPEALQIIRQIWQKIPRKYKYHHQFKKYDDYFNNWDCSVEGFEGIRAQDILPLLVETFSFETFFAYGGLIDIFTDRGFGPNFNPNDTKDTTFIDLVEKVNEQLISDGILKPTTMIAVMSNEHTASSRVYKNWSPLFCLRDPKMQMPVYDSNELLKDVFSIWNEGNIDTPESKQVYYILETNLKFSNQQNLPKGFFPGHMYLTYGWASADDGCTWSCCEDAALMIPFKHLPKEHFLLTISMHIYHSSLQTNTQVNVFINNQLLKQLKYENDPKIVVTTVTEQIPFSILQNQKNVEVKFMMPDRRQPQYEAGDDLRALGIGLISLKIS